MPVGQKNLEFFHNLNYFFVLPVDTGWLQKISPPQISRSPTTDDFYCLFTLKILSEKMKYSVQH